MAPDFADSMLPTSCDPSTCALDPQMRFVHRDISDIKDAIKELTKAVHHLAVVDERLANVQEQQVRISEQIEGISKRVSSVEAILPNHRKMSEWFEKTTWLAVGLIVMYVLKKTGLI